MDLHNFLSSAHEAALAKQPRAWLALARAFHSAHQSLDLPALLSVLGTGRADEPLGGDEAPQLDHVGLTFLMTAAEQAATPPETWTGGADDPTFSHYPSVLLRAAFEASGHLAPPISVFKSAPPRGCEVLIVETAAPSGDVSHDLEQTTTLQRVAGPPLHFAFGVGDEDAHDREARALVTRGFAPSASLKSRNLTEHLISSYFDGTIGSDSFRIELCYPPGPSRPAPTTQ